MNKIFTLSNRSENPWIETNDALTDMSEIKVTDKYCIVPYHIYEDSLCDDDYINHDVIENGSNFKYPIKHFSRIQNLREQSYHACVWYPEIKNIIPTAESLLIPIVSSSQVQDELKNNIAKYPFVRLCTMSPKDIKSLPLYDQWETAYNDLTISQRTNDLFEGEKHLFLRKKREYQWEVRCFWSHGQLRAVSIPNDVELTELDKEKILEFFKKYGKYIPYHSATVDIGQTDQIELIEFNTFGPDMKATAGNFSWREDVMILLFSPKPVFR